MMFRLALSRTTSNFGSSDGHMGKNFEKIGGLGNFERFHEPMATA